MRLFNVGEGIGDLQYARVLGRHQERVLALSWQVNGQHLASGAHGGTIAVHHVPTGAVVQRMSLLTGQGKGAIVWDMHLFADGATLVAGDSSCTVTVFELKTGTPLVSFCEHEADVSCIAVDESAGLIFAGGLDGKMIQLAVQKASRWAEARQEKRRASSRWRWIYTASRRVHTHDVLALAVCSGLGNWDTGRTEAEGPSHIVSAGVDSVLCVLPTDQGSFGAAPSSGGRDGGHVGGWLHSTPRKVLPYPYRSPLSLARDEGLLLCHHDASLQLWRLPPFAASPTQSKGQLTDRPVHLVDLVMSVRGAKGAAVAPRRNIVCSAISPSGKYVAAAHEKLRLWRVEPIGSSYSSAPQIRGLKVECGDREALHTALAFLPMDALLVATAGAPSSLSLVHPATGEQRCSVPLAIADPLHPGRRSAPVDSLVTSRAGDWAAALEWRLPGNQGGGDIHVLAVVGNGTAVARHMEVPAGQLPAPASAIGIVAGARPEGDPAAAAATGPLLVIVCARIKIVIYDIAQKAPCLAFAGLGVPRSLVRRTEHVVAVESVPTEDEAPQASKAGAFVLVSSGFVCRVPLQSRRGSGRTDPEPAKRPAKKSRRAGDRDSTPAGDPSLDPPPVVMDKFRPLLFAVPVACDAVFLVERPWSSVVSALPPAIQRHRFGT